MNRRQLLRGAMFVAAGGLFTPLLAHATGYPDRPIRIVIPFEPGGPTDLLVRAIAPIMTEELDQTIVIENKGGAGGSIGATSVARAQADGYTLLAGGSPTVQTPHFLREKPFDTHRDFTALAPLCITPYYLVVNSKLPVDSVSGLVEMAKRSPDTVSYASSGVGNGPHLAGVQFAERTRTRLMHVPYKGTAPATNDLLAGRVTFMFTSMATLRGHIQSGALKVLAVATPKRDPAFPDVQTLAEAGIPDFFPSVWYGLLAPTGMPEEAKQKINDAVRVALKDPDVIELYAKFGAVPYIAGTQEFQAFYDGEVKQWDDFFMANPNLVKESS